MRWCLHRLVGAAVQQREVCWRVEAGTAEAALLVFEWVESGVRARPDSSRTGFGRQLIEKALKFTLQARTELTFNADGISCHIEIPLPAAGSAGGDASKATPSQQLRTR